MHLQRLDLNLLVALEALLSTQSVTRAAEKLSISQPAMSGALNRLREHFGDPLIQRSGRGMVLTPFGLDLSGRVRKHIEQATELVQMRPGFDPATSDRSFTLVASDYAMAIFLPMALPHLARIAPRVSMHVETRAAEHERRFAFGMIDMVLVPESMAMPDSPGVPLFDDEYVCIVWQDNPEVGNSITQAQFLEMGHVIRVNPAAGEASGDERAVRAMGLTRRVTASVPAFGMLPRMVVGTPWVATVQRRLAEHAARHYPIRVLEHPLRLPALRMTLQWPAVRASDAGNEWLRSQFIELAGSLRA